MYLASRCTEYVRKTPLYASQLDEHLRIGTQARTHHGSEYRFVKPQPAFACPERIPLAGIQRDRLVVVQETGRVLSRPNIDIGQGYRRIGTDAEGFQPVFKPEELPGEKGFCQPPLTHRDILHIFHFHIPPHTGINEYYVPAMRRIPPYPPDKLIQDGLSPALAQRVGIDSYRLHRNCFLGMYIWRKRFSK